MTFYCETIPGHGHFLTMREKNRVLASTIVKKTLTEQHLARLSYNYPLYARPSVTQMLLDFVRR